LIANVARNSPRWSATGPIGTAMKDGSCFTVR
jgi:hypothetical protein